MKMHDIIIHTSLLIKYTLIKIIVCYEHVLREYSEYKLVAIGVASLLYQRGFKGRKYVIITFYAIIKFQPTSSPAHSM